MKNNNTFSNYFTKLKAMTTETSEEIDQSIIKTFIDYEGMQ